MTRWIIDLLRRSGVLKDQELHDIFFADLVESTKNFSTLTWLGQPIWQNILDLWNIQEVITKIRPALLIEVGTFKGGSAFFYASMMDLLNFGSVVSIDITRQHSLSHPRIEFLLGDSMDESILSVVRNSVRGVLGPVMVVLDGDHTENRVAQELVEYSKFVSPGSYILCQDGCIDTQTIFSSGRPGPLPAIRKFLRNNSDFVSVDFLNTRFPVTHHPEGWLQRRQD